MGEESPARGRLRTALLLALLIGGSAVALRVIGLRWELPNQRHYFSYHPDEVFLLLPSLQYFAQGDWNPHFFNYGSLYLYLVGLPAVWSGLAKDPGSLAPLYLLGRGITAGLGILSVALLYLAVRGENRRLALVSAALLAVLPLHVINSHYATVDVPATFWLVVAFLFAVRGARQMRAAYGALTGLAVGLAAATKYNAGLFLIPAMLAPALAGPRGWRWSWPGAMLLGAMVGFAMGCPYFASPDFWRDVRFELEHMRSGGTTAFVGMGSGWAYHLVHGLPVALGFPLLLALIPGVYAAGRIPNRAARLSLLWCALYFLMIGFAKERFIRYLAPMTPFLAVLAGLGLIWLWEQPRRRALGLAMGGLAAAVIALTGLYTWGQVRMFVTRDPRDEVWSRFGPSIVQSRGEAKAGLVQAPWYFSPPVSPYNAGPLSQRAFEEWNAEKGHPVVITGWDRGKLEAERPAAFFLSDLEAVDLLRIRNEETLRFVETLEELYGERVQVARPRAPFSWLAPGLGWAPPDWRYPSPQIMVYLSPKSFYAQRYD